MKTAFRFKLHVVRSLGIARWFQYFIAQRLFGINYRVFWPVHWSSIVTHPDRIKFPIFDRSGGGLHFPGVMPGQYIQGNGGISIGKNCIMAMGVKIISSNHDINDYSKHLSGGVVIGDNCWLGVNSVVLPGVTLGNHVVVAAGAVVSKSFGANCLIGGVPARKIKDLPIYTGENSMDDFSLGNRFVKILKRRIGIK